MGLGAEDKQLELAFDGAQIIIRKAEPLKEFAKRCRGKGNDVRLFALLPRQHSMHRHLRGFHRSPGEGGKPHGIAVQNGFEGKWVFHRHGSIVEHGKSSRIYSTVINGHLAVSDGIPQCRFAGTVGSGIFPIIDPHLAVIVDTAVRSGNPAISIRAGIPERQTGIVLNGGYVLLAADFSGDQEEYCQRPGRWREA